MFLRKLEERQRTFEAILPLLSSLHGTAHEKTGVTMYEGTDGFKQFWRRLYESGVKERYLMQRIIAERIKRGIRSRQLIPENRETHKFVARDKNELRESRFLPSDVVLPASILLFENEAAFITTRKENSVILVTSGDTSVTLRTMFELLWLHAKTNV